MVKKPSQQALNRAAVTVEQAEGFWLSALRINHTARRKNPNQKNNVGTTISLGEKHACHNRRFGIEE
ncbi:hypothetical protein WI402_25055 (plasmid) [Salmonella enterica subsp. enterica serovar Typhimurium]|uniref:hypothetical protein n=1 Tax=Salmonella enterica TaxID=28901 RepID=UPI0030D24AFB